MKKMLSEFIGIIIVVMIIVVYHITFHKDYKSRQSYEQHEYQVGNFNVIEFPSVNNPNLICIYIYQAKGAGTLECGGR